MLSCIAKLSILLIVKKKSWLYVRYVIKYWGLIVQSILGIRLKHLYMAIAVVTRPNKIITIVLYPIPRRPQIEYKTCSRHIIT